MLLGCDCGANRRMLNFCITDIFTRYVPEKLELSVFDPMYKLFANVFENFRITDAGKIKTENETKPGSEEGAKMFSKIPKIDLDDEVDEEIGRASCRERV